MNSKIFTVLLISILVACPATSISRWFSATYNDLKFTMYRYAHCYNGLQPLTSANLNETDYLVHQIKMFLDQANYDNEQLANVTALMDNICHENLDNYAVSNYINLTMYSNSFTYGKINRCQAIDDAMDSMYHVFRRAALNRSEQLDFSVIQFYPNSTDRAQSYNLTDLINVSWIKSETTIEQVCSITNATKEYVLLRTSNATAEARGEPPASGPFGSLAEYFNQMLDHLLGLQKRLYWEGANRFGQIQSRISSGLGSIRGGLGAGLDRVRQRQFGARTNATAGALNSTSTRDAFNSTAPRDQLVSAARDSSSSFNSTGSSNPSTLSVLSTTPANVPRTATTLAPAPTSSGPTSMAAAGSANQKPILAASTNALN